MLESLDPATILNAIKLPILVIGANQKVVDVNHAGEHLFQGSRSYLCGHALRDLLPEDSPLLGLLEQVRTSGTPVSEYGLVIESPPLRAPFRQYSCQSGGGISRSCGA